MRTTTVIASLATLFLIATTATACGGKIGDSCTENEDCPDMCQTGGDFPGGICTLECESTADCPDGWVCISDSSGICMLECTADAECVEEFSDQWVCEDKSLQEGSGTANVCFGS